MYTIVPNTSYSEARLTKPGVDQIKAWRGAATVKDFPAATAARQSREMTRVNCWPVASDELMSNPFLVRTAGRGSEIPFGTPKWRCVGPKGSLMTSMKYFSASGSSLFIGTVFRPVTGIVAYVPIDAGENIGSD